MNFRDRIKRLFLKKEARKQFGLQAFSLDDLVFFANANNLKVRWRAKSKKTFETALFDFEDNIFIL